jgi:hypothetical protein
MFVDKVKRRANEDLEDNSAPWMKATPWARLGKRFAAAT